MCVCVFVCVCVCMCVCAVWVSGPGFSKKLKSKNLSLKNMLSLEKIMILYIAFGLFEKRN